MNWLRNFMYGRNGADHLSLAFVVVGLIVSVVVSFLNIPILTFIPYIPYGYSIFRIMSKDISKRRAENARFLVLWNPIQRSIAGKASQFKDKTHKYYSCPSCKATLRVPKGKGKITITCPKCKNQITKKT